MKFEPEVSKALDAVGSAIHKEYPELYEVLEQARKGEITEEEACTEMLALLGKEEHQGLEALFREKLAPIGPDDPPDVAGAFYTGTGLPQMNPLFEAALIERAQFDGDIPEFRTGPLPQNVLPSPSVETKSQNPVAIGLMLTQASKQVRDDYKAHEKKRLGPLSKDSKEEPSEALVQSDMGALVQGSQATDLPSYRRGEVPAPLTIQTPTGSALASLSEGERQELAWKFVSSTQGRRTALPAICEGILKHLPSDLDLEVGVGAPNPQAEVLSYKDWTLVLSGPKTSSTTFNLIGTASICLAKGLMSNLKVKAPHKKLRLEVHTINTVADRKVGWGARFVWA